MVGVSDLCMSCLCRVLPNGGGNLCTQIYDQVNFKGAKSRQRAEQSRGPEAPAQPEPQVVLPALCSQLPALGTVLLALCAQVHVPSSVLCSWLHAPGSVLPALCSWLCAPGSVCPALCAWESRMAGFKGTAVLLKGLTENKPFHRMDETRLKHLSPVF